MSQEVKPYVRAQSFNGALISDGMWYAMEDSDKDIILANENVIFGDKVYIIKSKAFYVCGNDNQWYPA